MATGEASAELPVTAWPALVIADQVRKGMITATDVLEAHLEQVRSQNPTLNAIVTLAEDMAREQAANIDSSIAAGAVPGPLAGVPFTVKDLIATRGVRSTAGSLILRDHVPAWGATAVERLCAADAVLLGKANCPEFGLAVHTGNRLFGETLSPLGPDLSPAGSSGGDASAVASGMAAFGIGTDYGGSIRVPAHCTGLAALRPTPGLIPGTGQIPFPPWPGPFPPGPAPFAPRPAPFAPGPALFPPGPAPVAPGNSLQARLQSIAPIARRVGDLWPLLQVMAGPDGIDVNAVPATLGHPDQVSVADLPVAWCAGDGSFPVRADLVQAVESAANVLADLGATVIARRPPGLERAEQVYAALRGIEGLPEHRALVTGREAELTSYARELIYAEPGRPAGSATLRELTAAADDLRAEVAAFMRQWPILLMPVASVPGFPPGTAEFRVGGQVLSGAQMESCCRAVTLLGAPAVVVRCGSSTEGLPVGVQVVGRPFHDAETVAVAAALERHVE
jgi:Asp-tRNA(Asn)/Glu-tRNA(Gln) amidotransferase A subunit family amidase